MGRCNIHWAACPDGEGGKRLKRVQKMHDNTRQFIETFEANKYMYRKISLLTKLLSNVGQLSSFF